MRPQDDDAEMGPVDLAVIGFPPGAPMTGEAVPLLLDLVERGVVRVLDVMFVTKSEDGRVSGFEATDLDSASVGDFQAFEGASSGLLGDHDVTIAGEALDPGSAAVMLLYENHWAAPLVAAVRRNGGVPVAFERVSQQDLLDAVDVAA
jgi:Family of unknown function (DUF6325)